MRILKRLIIFLTLSLALLIIGGLLFFYLKTHQLHTSLDINRIAKLEITPTDKSLIYIIGTDHIEQENFNSDSILYALCKIQPDVIALEGDSSLFNNKFNFKFPTLFKLGVAYGQAKFENEGKASLNYRNINKDVQFRPFDISNRNAFHNKNKLRSNSAKAWNEIDNHFNKNKLTPLNKITWENWLSTNEEYKNLWNHNNYPTVLNGEKAIDICRRRQQFQYDSINQIIQREDALKSHRQFYQINRDFWHLRNKTMVKNIIAIAQEFKSKKIVVLTGASHKYYLLDELNKTSDKDYETREFYK